eukprot:CAMPEP_0169412856 /NCGR_PEP_ID=MMETSP1017-20121227/61045_1 /TAXON_ID=342587 /ORGANISM="Karlodinium micrum, Strain CCMP2283" /LENGTH=60 /DNA_ID=CAMNT_0009520231 /DNA_START=256 /DNA_END=435 /DNA_ORIENTATION=+
MGLLGLLDFNASEHDSALVANNLAVSECWSDGFAILLGFNYYPRSLEDDAHLQSRLDAWG